MNEVRKWMLWFDRQEIETLRQHGIDSRKLEQAAGFKFIGDNRSRIVGEQRVQDLLTHYAKQ